MRRGLFQCEKQRRERNSSEVESEYFGSCQACTRSDRPVQPRAKASVPSREFLGKDNCSLLVSREIAIRVVNLILRKF